MAGDIRSSSRSDAGFSMIELMIVMAIISVIAAIGISSGMHAFDSARLGRSIGNARGVSEALLRYQTDTSSLPGGGLQKVSNITSLLIPVSGRVAEVDGWENDLYYEPITVSGYPTYRIYSYGKGGIPDGVVTGNWVDYYTDVVIEGGSFIQTKY